MLCGILLLFLTCFFFLVCTGLLLLHLTRLTERQREYFPVGINSVGLPVGAKKSSDYYCLPLHYC